MKSRLTLRVHAEQKCKEIRELMQRVSYEHDHPNRDRIMADLRKSLAIWRKELDRVW